MRLRGVIVLVMAVFAVLGAFAMVMWGATWMLGLCMWAVITTMEWMLANYFASLGSFFHMSIVAFIWWQGLYVTRTFLPSKAMVGTWFILALIISGINICMVVVAATIKAIFSGSFGLSVRIMTVYPAYRVILQWLGMCIDTGVLLGPVFVKADDRARAKYKNRLWIASRLLMGITSSCVLLRLQFLPSAEGGLVAFLIHIEAAVEVLHLFLCGLPSSTPDAQPGNTDVAGRVDGFANWLYDTLVKKLTAFAIPQAPPTVEINNPPADAKEVPPNQTGAISTPVARVDGFVKGLYDTLVKKLTAFAIPQAPPTVAINDQREDADKVPLTSATPMVVVGENAHDGLPSRFTTLPDTGTTFISMPASERDTVQQLPLDPKEIVDRMGIVGCTKGWFSGANFSGSLEETPAGSGGDLAGSGEGVMVSEALSGFETSQCPLFDECVVAMQRGVKRHFDEEYALPGLRTYDSDTDDDTVNTSALDGVEPESKIPRT